MPHQAAILKNMLCSATAILHTTLIRVFGMEGTRRNGSLAFSPI